MSTPGQKPSAAGTATTSQFTSVLNPALAKADASASTTVQALKLVHQARAAQLTRTAAALKATYGAGDSRTVKAEAAVTAENAAVARISIASQQVSTPAPAVAAGGWALHGRIYDAQLKPAAQLTVYLVDTTKTYQQQYSFAYTDASGYFLINYAPPASQAASTTPLYVAIANSKGQPVYLSETAFQPTSNSAAYQNISLAATTKTPLGDPPPAIRKVAIPPQSTKPKAK